MNPTLKTVLIALATLMGLVVVLKLMELSGHSPFGKPAIVAQREGSGPNSQRNNIQPANANSATFATNPNTPLSSRPGVLPNAPASAVATPLPGNSGPGYAIEGSSREAEAIADRADKYAKKTESPIWKTTPASREQRLSVSNRDKGSATSANADPVVRRVIIDGLEYDPRGDVRTLSTSIDKFSNYQAEAVTLPPPPNPTRFTLLSVIQTKRGIQLLKAANVSVVKSAPRYAEAESYLREAAKNANQALELLGTQPSSEEASSSAKGMSIYLSALQSRATALQLLSTMNPEETSNAETAYQNYLVAQPDPAKKLSAQREMAQALFDAGALDKAQVAYQKLLDQDSKDELALTRLSQIRTEMAARNEAEDRNISPQKAANRKRGKENTAADSAVGEALEKSGEAKMKPSQKARNVDAATTKSRVKVN